jgi:hypothetical protein
MELCKPAGGPKKKARKIHSFFFIFSLSPSLLNITENEPITAQMALCSRMHWQHVLLACLLSWFSSAMLVENPRTTPVIFKIGVFKFDRNIDDHFTLEILKQCSSLENHPTFDHNAVFLLFKSMQGWRLAEAAESRHHRLASWEASARMSHRINSCPSMVKLNEEKEVLLHVALAVWPWNIYVHKNLLYYYEWHGYSGAMQALNADALLLTGDESLLLHQVFLAPPILYSENQAEDIHLRMLQKSYEFVSHAAVTTRNPQHDIRELQQNIEYIGYSIGIVMELYVMCVQHRYAPYFFQSVPTLVIPPHDGVLQASHPTIRVGVLSEHANNGAPDLCIADIFKFMQLTCKEEVHSFCTTLEIVFFDRPRLKTDFATVLRRRANEVVMLIENDIAASARAVLEASVDVLLYIALPTEKFTVLLSQYRLAETQIVFGKKDKFYISTTLFHFYTLIYNIIMK